MRIFGSLGRLFPKSQTLRPIPADLNAVLKRPLKIPAFTKFTISNRPQMTITVLKNPYVILNRSERAGRSIWLPENLSGTAVSELVRFKYPRELSGLNPAKDTGKRWRALEE